MRIRHSAEADLWRMIFEMGTAMSALMTREM